MISRTLLPALCIAATSSPAQAIDIRGTVKDTAGAVIVGAVVTLESANISTTTGADGGFVLAKSARARRTAGSSSPGAAGPVLLPDGTVELSLREQAPVALQVFDVGGRRLGGGTRVYGPGRHVCAAPSHSAGVRFYSITAGRESWSFKSPPMGSSFAAAGPPSATVGGPGAAKRAEPAAITDVVAVTRDGYLNHRFSIRTADTSGILVRMLPNAGDVKDADGNIYQTVKIGNQVWTAENLRTTRFNDGTGIALTGATTAWLNLYKPMMCYYGNSALARDQQKWGALYNWLVIGTGKLAPAGWRVPTVTDWETLRSTLTAGGYNWDGSTSENKVARSLAARADWPSSSIAGAIGNDLAKNNGSGFSALPGGSRSLEGEYLNQGALGVWWTATEYDKAYAYEYCLDYSHEPLLHYADLKRCGCAVRLVKD